MGFVRAGAGSIRRVSVLETCIKCTHPASYLLDDLNSCDHETPCDIISWIEGIPSYLLCFRNLWRYEGIGSPLPSTILYT